MLETRSSARVIGLALLWIGGLLMLAVGFLSSWWFVPQIRSLGFSNVPVSIFVSILWGASAPLGAMLIAIGGALYAKAEKRFVGLLILGSLAVIAFSIAFNMREVVPPLFGAVGGLITLFYLGMAWRWARSRPAMQGQMRAGSDLTMIGHNFFLFAAWYLCGYLGAPTFTIRPELMERYGTASSAVSLGSLIAVYLAVGWGFCYFGQLIGQRADG